jgi:hypothetical protein
LNLLAFIKSDPPRLTGAKEPQGRPEPFGGEFKALLSDKTAAAAQEQNAGLNAKSVALPESLTRRSATKETFENAKVPIQRTMMDIDDPTKKSVGRAKTDPSPAVVCELHQIVRAEPKISLLSEVKPETGGKLDDPEFVRTQLAQMSTESDNEPSRVLAVPGHMNASPIDKPPTLLCCRVSDGLLQNDFGSPGFDTDSLSSRPAIDGNDMAYEKLNVQTDAGRSEIEEMRSPDTATTVSTMVLAFADVNPPTTLSQDIESDMKSDGLTEPAEPVVLQEASSLQGPAGEPWVKYCAEIMSPGTKGSPIPHPMRGQPTMVARIISQARLEQEAERMHEGNLSMPEQSLTSSTPTFVGETGMQSTEAIARIGLTKFAEEPGASIPAIRPSENPMPMPAELNVAPLPRLNSGNILASIEQMATELATTQTYQTEAEEVRAEIHGRMKSIRIMLRPEKLGEVSVHVHSLQDKLRIEVKVLSDDAGRALLPEIDAIASALSGLGLPVEQLTLTAPGGGITVVHSPESRGSNTASQGDNSQFRERSAGEHGSQNRGQHRNQADDKTILQSQGIYI